MKKQLFFILSGVILSSSILSSCNKDKEPAVVIAGNYMGSFEGTYLGNDTLTSSGYAVQVEALNDNKVKITGHDFTPFEVLVTTNGINIEAVSKSDPYLTNFLYISDENKLKFTFNKGGNEAKYIGIK